MSSILLRKMTKKSTINFGKFKECTVEQLFGMKKQIGLISMYFNLSTITFTDEILDELGITAEYRIDKPSTSREIYDRFIAIKYGKKQAPSKELQRMQRETRSLSKGYLQQMNQKN